MRIEEKELIIDNVIIKDRTYIAEDGKVFQFESNCHKYETELNIKRIPLKNVNFMGYKNWYYISSIEDFYTLKDYIAIVVQSGTRTYFDVYNVKNRFINNWVSYEIERDNDAYSCYFTSFKELEKTLNAIIS